MTNKNIVFFSSGVTERNGILGAMVSSLTAAGFHCSYWSDLFSGAKDLSGAGRAGAHAHP